MPMARLPAVVILPPFSTMTWPALPPPAALVSVALSVEALPPTERASTPYTPSPRPVTVDEDDEVNVTVDASPPRPALLWPPKSPECDAAPPPPPCDSRPTAALEAPGPGARAVTAVAPCRITVAAPPVPPQPESRRPPNPFTRALSLPSPPQDWAAMPKPVPVTVLPATVSLARCPSPPIP